MTGVTEKLFMCQMFMCLFRPLESAHGKFDSACENVHESAPGDRSFSHVVFAHVLFLAQFCGIWGQQGTIRTLYSGSTLFNRSH